MKNAEAKEIKNWYRQLKANVTCAYCDYHGILAPDNRIELHHIKPETKRKPVSHLIFPVPYNIVTVAVEMMKVAPLHPDYHAELHRVEKSDPNRFKRDFDMINDPRYIGIIQKFRASVIDSLPQKQRVIDYMFDKGFEL